METALLTAILAFLLIASIAVNAYLFKQIKKPKVEVAYDARQLLHDITAGAGIVRITVIDPVGLMLRSPRDIG